MKAALRAAALAAAGLVLVSAQEPPGEKPNADPWEPVRFLVGDWRGVSDGQAGRGTVQRSYSFVLKDRYLHEKNVSTYPPKDASKPGEVHEHWSFFSFDRERKTLVLRQFHQEGFVNQYTLNQAESAPGKLVFDSERFENFDNAWRARETYVVRTPDKFVETFELGEPGKDLEVYSTNEFKRVRP
jgi:hypothetical protein